MSEAVKIWADTLQDVLRNCLPHELRVQVLSALLERERACKPLRIIGMDELMAMKFAPYRAKKEVYALVVQITLRPIANNHSPEMAAALMFRDQHGYATGSGWLPGLPGISVDLKACAATADGAGPCRLCEAMATSA